MKHWKRGDRLKKWMDEGWKEIDINAMKEVLNTIEKMLETVNNSNKGFVEEMST